jgi:hypothetical protein
VSCLSSCNVVENLCTNYTKKSTRFDPRAFFTYACLRHSPVFIGESIGTATLPCPSLEDIITIFDHLFKLARHPHRFSGEADLVEVQMHPNVLSRETRCSPVWQVPD